MSVSQLFSSHGSGDHRDLHSFPTRRSSDLARRMLPEACHDRGRVESGTEATEYLEDWQEGLSAAVLPILEVLGGLGRSEEHTSELQSLRHLVCRLLLEKKKKKTHSTAQTET